MIYLGRGGEVWEGGLIPALGPVYQLCSEDLLSIFCSKDPDVGGVWLGDPEPRHRVCPLPHRASKEQGLRLEIGKDSEEEQPGPRAQPAGGVCFISVIEFADKQQ